jgi:kynurenine formamidase
MATQQEWRAISDKVRNWGKWGPEDQLGTLNYVTPEKIRQGAACVRQGKVIPLGVNFDADLVWGTGGFRRNPIHLMSVDGGDHDLAQRLKGWGGSTEAQMVAMGDSLMRFNDDFIIMPLQAGTQWDALSHVYYDEKYYNGFPASAVTSFGATKCSIDQVDVKGPTGRAVFLDVAHHRGVPHLPPNTPIMAGELDAVAKAQGVTVGSGDFLLVRTGWWSVFKENRKGEEWIHGSPGLSWTCAQWLHEKQIAAVAVDNVAVEVSAADVEGVSLPLHLLCIRDMGMMFGEIWDFEGLSKDCAADGVYEMQLAAPPIRVTGAVGSPLDPLAIK